MKAFKDGNKLYAASDWRAAAAKYEEALQLDPDKTATSVLLPRQLLRQHVPADAQGRATNDGYLDKAIDELQDGQREASARGPQKSVRS